MSATNGHVDNEQSARRRRHSRSNGGLIRNNSVEEGENLVDDRRLVFNVTPLKSVVTDHK